MSNLLQHIDIDTLRIFWQLVLAMFFGLIIGLEREYHRKAAGLRTYALVSLGSALFTIISYEGLSSVTQNPGFDPSRIASQIVVGIGFIGGGLIFQQGDKVLGLTTAAAIWAVAAIGVAVGIGMYSVAAFTTVLVLTVVWVFRFVEKVLPRIDSGDGKNGK